MTATISPTRPATLLAEAELCLGRAEAATEWFEHAYAASRQLRDPCWEAMARAAPRPGTRVGPCAR